MLPYRLGQLLFLAGYAREKFYFKATPSKVHLQLVPTLATSQLCGNLLIHVHAQSRCFTSKISHLPTGLVDSTEYSIIPFQYEVASSQSGHLQFFRVLTIVVTMCLSGLTAVALPG